MSVVTTTKERPIIFTGESVRAILDGHKTQTRRVVKRIVGICDECWKHGVPHNQCDLEVKQGEPNIAGALFGTIPYLRVGACDHNNVFGDRVRCPYGKAGDRLWVKEAAWISPEGFTSQGLATHPNGRIVQYEASESDGEYAENYGIKKTPSIFMPRWASRITLEIVDVRIERLREITRQDVEAEGFQLKPKAWSIDDETIKSIFGHKWDRINGKRKGCSWADNPWVWVIEFRRITDEQ